MASIIADLGEHLPLVQVPMLKRPLFPKDKGMPAVGKEHQLSASKKADMPATETLAGAQVPQAQVLGVLNGKGPLAVRRNAYGPDNGVALQGETLNNALSSPAGGAGPATADGGATCNC